MKFLSALLYYVVIVPISLLPNRALYAFSDFLFWLMYQLVGYRKAVVRSNLDRSFPEKSVPERRQIEAGFYRHFCDLLVESFKMFNVSEAELHAMFEFKNAELTRPYYEQGRNILMCGGHFNNWEVYAVASPFGSPHITYGVYKPLQNAWFDQLMRKTRGKFGLLLVSMEQAKTVFFQPHDRPWLTILGMDQSPGSASRAYWMEFLHQDTAVFFGPEKYARDINAVVVFGCIGKDRRGHYTFEYRLITENPRLEPHGAITEKVMRMLESDIRNQPSSWLWSHKRWKFRRPEKTANDLTSIESQA